MEELLPSVNLDENLTNIMNELLGESTLNCETSNTSFDSNYSSEIENVQPCNFETIGENFVYIPEVNVSSNTLRLILRALSSDDSSFCVKSPTKKRPCQPDMWQQNIRKKLRECGKPYTDKHGIQRPGRKMGLPCSELCFYRCTQKITQRTRAELHNKYWSLNDVEKKAYILLSVQPCDVKRRRKSSTQRKSRTFNYYFDTKEETVQVCKKFFLSTIGISERKIYYLYNVPNNEDNDDTQTKPKIRGRPRTKIQKIQKETVGEKMQEIENQYVASNDILKICTEQLGLPCSDNCVYQCTQLFNEEARAELHNKYQNLSDTEKESHIFGSVQQSDGNCADSFDFYIDTNIASVQVCKEFYLSTFGISENVIYNLFNASNYEEHASVPKNFGLPSTNIDKIQEVTEHVLNFYAL
ncbi:uncharacterized protein [Eurosta solidaginis]|uniref:uncharacterized protein n=1 Tax=Eurosta solidaginis TaxID=178769 RepID=UPI003530AB23